MAADPGKQGAEALSREPGLPSRRAPWRPPSSASPTRTSGGGWQVARRRALPPLRRPRRARASSAHDLRRLPQGEAHGADLCGLSLAVHPYPPVRRPPTAGTALGCPRARRRTGTPVARRHRRTPAPGGDGQAPSGPPALAPASRTLRGALGSICRTRSGDTPNARAPPRKPEACPHDLPLPGRARSGRATPPERHPVLRGHPRPGPQARRSAVDRPPGRARAGEPAPCARGVAGHWPGWRATPSPAAPCSPLQPAASGPRHLRHRAGPSPGPRGHVRQQAHARLLPRPVP